MASNTSTVQVLKINPVESGKSKKTGNDWERHTAECMLLADDGSIECVGKMDIPQALRGKLVPGIYRAGFSFYVPTFGDKKGDITSRFIDLVLAPTRTGPVPAKTLPASPQA